MPGRVLLEPGKRIGRFDIQQAVHSSDLSATYKAHDPDYERFVALKIAYETEPAAIQGHLAAARAASKLDHENIAATHGGGQLPGAVLLVSEYYDGLALGVRLARKESFAWTEVLDLTRQLCAAIDYSRTKDAIHNRLHPGNIQIGWDGSIKVLDFGSGPATQDAYTGWSYMAPEQVRNEAASAASNVFNVAAIVYHLITGEPAFPAPTVGATKLLVLRCQPKNPMEIKSNLPEGIAKALERGLALNPSERFTMGADFCAELEKHRFWNPAVAVPTRPQGLPPELMKPMVIGVKPVQPAPAPETVVSDAESGTYAAATGTGKNPAQTGSTRVASQTGSYAPEASGQQTVYGGTSVPAGTAPEAHGNLATAATRSGSYQRQPQPQQPRQVGLPPLPPAARKELDAAWSKVKDAAQSPRRPLEWLLMAAAVVLLVVMLIAVGVQTYFHHKANVEAATDNASNPSNAASTNNASVLQQPDVPMANTSQQEQSSDDQPDGEETRSIIRGARHHGRSRTAATPRVAGAGPGAIMISVQPGDAQVFADGVAFMSGGGTRQIASGQHTFVFSRPGYATQTQVVRITGGMQSNLVVRLNAQAAMVALTSSPAGANIYVDGKDTGRLTPAEVTVSQGVHTVTLRKYGFLDSVNSANARMGQTVSITTTLQPTNDEPIKTVGGGLHLFGDKVPAGMVKVKFVSSPKGAQVQINGQLLEKDTPVEAVLKPGRYQVNFMADGYRTDHKVITVTNNKKQEVSSTLQPF